MKTKKGSGKGTIIMGRKRTILKDKDNKTQLEKLLIRFISIKE